MASGADSSTSTQTTETKLADLLDSTLWNRRLAPSSERIVYGLVQQIFHGIREYFLVSTELKVCNVSCLFMYASFCVWSANFLLFCLKWKLAKVSVEMKGWLFGFKYIHNLQYMVKFSDYLKRLFWPRGPYCLYKMTLEPYNYLQN